MKLYTRDFLIDILEAKLLEAFEEYNPQGQYNNRFIQYLYKYIRLNTYCGEHDDLLRKFVALQLGNPLFKKTDIREYTDRRTFVLTDDTEHGINDRMLYEIAQIVREYYNYQYTMISENRVIVQVNFGWLPPNTATWLNLFNDECLIDYYISGITLVPNTHESFKYTTHDRLNQAPFTHDELHHYTHDEIRLIDYYRYIDEYYRLMSHNRLNEGGYKHDFLHYFTHNEIKRLEYFKMLKEGYGIRKRPDSGKVCYRITNIREFDTIMFLVDKEAILDTLTEEEKEKFKWPKIKVATLLTEIEGSKGATLNRIVECDMQNFFYELGPYLRNYLSAERSSLIIEIPYEWAVGDFFRVYDVSNSVKINNQNNPDDENDIVNFWVPFNDPDFANKFTKYGLKSPDIVEDRVLHHASDLDTRLIQYLLGDFIWKTTDSKIIGYAQHLVDKIYGSELILSNGIWTDDMSRLVNQYKKGDELSLFDDDDVLDKDTESSMISEYKRRFIGKDPNEELFNYW